MMSLENTAVKEKQKETNSSTPHDGCRIAVEYSRTESSRGSPTDLPTERKRVKIQPGKPSKDDQRHQISQRNRRYAQKSVKRTAAAPRRVKPIQVETNAAQPEPVKQSELHINPLSNRVRKPTEQNRVAQPVKESENHINPTSSGVRKSIQQNKVSLSIKESNVAYKTVRTVNPQKVSLVKENTEAVKSSPMSIKQNKVAQPVKKSEMHINPSSDGVRKSIELIKPPSSGVGKSIRQNKVSQPIKTSVANKTARTVNPQKGRRVKEKNEAAKSSPTPSSKPASQIHYIQWHGFESFHESIGWNCSLCENDLAHSPTEEEHETVKFPDVAVLPCGHAFHNVCLQVSTSKLQCSDPLCIICPRFQS